MEIQVQLTHEPIAEKFSPPSFGAAGAWAEFRGIVRGEENGAAISALEYETYPGMAESEIRRLLSEIFARHPCLAAIVIHRIGVIPVGETAIYVGIAAKHRGPAFAALAEFMDRLKKDVPIWKLRGISYGARLCAERQPQQVPRAAAGSPTTAAPRSLDEALAEIQSRCRLLPGVRAPLLEAAGRILREPVCAPEDSPSSARSTRDGYAVLRDDFLGELRVVDTLHAADWKPRQLNPGEAVRVATGAALPCENLHVVMQEHVERSGNRIKILRRETALNVRQRGEEWRAGDALLAAGRTLDAGAQALLASVGCTQPLVSPRLRVVHFTTGDEIIPPEQTPKPGQVRDSNSILVRAMLEKFGCEVRHAHLPEDFERAKSEISNLQFQIAAADVLLVSGGASVGEKDFTRPLLEWLGFEIVFNRLNLRPGAPLIFGANAAREDARPSVAFGLPGNPLSHFVCFHLFVAAALRRLLGAEPARFQSGTLAEKLEDAPNPRETLWPARLGRLAGKPALHPLRWSSSGDVKVLAETEAMIRVPGGAGALATGTEVEFLPV
jgi:molybdopterin molybdotransferase